MPFPPERRRGSRLVGGILGSPPPSAWSVWPRRRTRTTTTRTRVSASARWCRCHRTRRTTKPGPPTSPDNKPGNDSPATPGPAASPAPARPRRARPPRRHPPRMCAKHIWFYNGTYGDPWGFALRNCTSFVAWRLRTTNGMTDFSNHLAGGSFGNAEHWDDNALALGYLVDDAAGRRRRRADRRRPGRPRRVGLGRGRRAPSPSRSTTTSSPAGTTSARCRPPTSATCTSTTSRPTRASARRGPAPPRPRPVAASGPRAPRPRATSPCAGRRGTSYVSGTAAAGRRTPRRPWPPTPSVAPGWPRCRQDGQVLTAHTRGDLLTWTTPRAVRGGPWSATASPTLALDGQGRVRLLTVVGLRRRSSSATRRGRTDRWTRGDRMGMPGSWSTHAAPAATTDARRPAVGRGRHPRQVSLQTRHADDRGRAGPGSRRSTTAPGPRPRARRSPSPTTDASG